MKEIELRFHIPADQQERLLAYVRQGGQPERLSLAAVYLDSTDRRLARAGIGLRLRKEGRRWVQTCKGPAEDGMTRLEHNAALPPGAPVQVDVTRHAGHPLGASIVAALDGAKLIPTFRTEVRRTLRTRRLRGATIELALDQGRLLAVQGTTEASLPVHELELELLHGQPGALLAHAHALVGRWPLSLDVRSKAERGENLSQGRTQSPARKALPLRLQAAMTPAEALRALLLNTFDHAAPNASQIGSGASEPEHLHQLRVGLRRLRSGLKLFRGLWPELAHSALPAFERQAAAWFRQLGALRDEDVLAGGLSPALQAAMAQALGAQAPTATVGKPRTCEAATAAVRNPAAQQFLLEWLGWIEVLGRSTAWVAGAPDANPLPLRRGLKRRLNRWHEQLRELCGRFGELDAAGRHELRKRFKRLRYAAEFSAGLFSAEGLAEALKPIVKAQERLGELNDLETALSRSRARLAQAPQAWFEVGWLSAQRDTLLARMAPLMTAVADGPALARGKGS